MKDYHIFIPNYTVGAECYKEIPWATRKYGKQPLLSEEKQQWLR